MSHDAPLAGSHAVVTGGSRGIGLAIAHRLASLGASLSLIGRDRARLFAAVQSLPDGARCDAHVCDVADARAVERAFAAIAKTGHKASILVNNAGVATGARLAQTDDALWAETIGASLSGAFHCSRAALPALLEARAGRIVNVASTAGLVGYPYVAAYCAAKHGVVGLTRALAVELGARGVTVNCICPGPIRTGMTDAIPEEMKTKFARRRVPLRRYGDPEEVAHMTLSLALPASSYVNGAVIPVDGGLLVQNT
jgi:NAD(P)-dependent dehydrogenase (short-subunit alcohol dehydrogenase family)